MGHIYAFFCSRYGNITYKELLDMGYDEFIMKLNSIPESEPLYKIIKSRSININNIKNKDEKEYWQELKKDNRIPDIYKSHKEIEKETQRYLNNGGIKNVK